MDPYVIQDIAIAGIILSSLVAIGILLLATLTWYSLRYTIREYKDKQLGEVIEWAEDTTRISESIKQNVPRQIDVHRPLLSSFLALMFLHNELTRFIRRGTRVKNIVRTFNSKSLSSTFDELFKAVNEYDWLIIEQLKGLDPLLMTETEEFKAARDKLPPHESSIKSSADRVIDEAYNLKYFP